MRNPELKAVVPDLLGTYAKSATPPLSLGEIQGVAEQKSIVRGLRAQRFELLATARRVLSDAGRAAGLQFWHNFHKTAKCMHIMRAQFVGVHVSKQHQKAFYSGLVTCGSVWSCPVCAAKVQERRRQEIAKSIEWAYEKELQPALVTLTFPHRSWHSLPDLLAKQADALHRLRAGSPWSRLKERVGYEGLIRSLELTHGENGWHPHTHELWFIGAGVEAEKLQADVLVRWQAACARAGLLNERDLVAVAAFQKHAVDVKGWCSASDYLAKQDDSKHWGADRELAKASSKAGKAKGQHAFGLLALAATDKQAGELFAMYSATMRGKRQIFWSHGLKERVGVDEVSDEALAEQQREPSDLLGQLDDEDWRTIRLCGAHSAVLDAAEGGGWPAVMALLDRLTRAEIKRLEAVLNPEPVS